MEQKFLKRGFNFTEELLAEWARFHAPSKDYSPSAAAAFLLYMVIEPSLREALRKLALKKDISKARIEARKLLRETIINAYWTGFIGLQSDEDKKILLERFVQSEENKKIIDIPVIKKSIRKKLDWQGIAKEDSSHRSVRQQITM